MEKTQVPEKNFFEWWDSNGRSHWKRRDEPRRVDVKETPEEMIRALQGIFCKGRYRSWKPPVRKSRA